MTTEKKDKTCTLYLVRHGETKWNQLGKIQGHTDIKLSERGLSQSEARTETFCDNFFSGVLAFIFYIT